MGWGSETAAGCLLGCRCPTADAKPAVLPRPPPQMHTHPRLAESSFPHSCIVAPGGGGSEAPGHGHGGADAPPWAAPLTLPGWVKDIPALEPPVLIAFIPSVARTWDVSGWTWCHCVCRLWGTAPLCLRLGAAISDAKDRWRQEALPSSCACRRQGQPASHRVCLWTGPVASMFT